MAGGRRGRYVLERWLGRAVEVGVVVVGVVDVVDAGVDVVGDVGDDDDDGEESHMDAVVNAQSERKK